MGIIGFTRPTGDESNRDLAELIAKLQKQVEFLMNGNVSSKNVREIGGWLVDDDRIVSKDGDVGMSTADTEADDVRHWAGDTVPENAPWRITKSGKMHATGATIESSDGYPKYRIDPDTGVMGFYYDELNYIEFSPTYLGGPPAISATVNGNAAYQIIASSSGVVIGTGGKKLTLNTTAEGNIEILPETGYNVIVPGWSNLLGLDGVSLASELISLQNNLQNQIDDVNSRVDGVGSRISNLTVSVPNHNHGNPDNLNSGGGTFDVNG